MVVYGQGWNEVQSGGCQTENNLESVKSIGLAGQAALGNWQGSEFPIQLDTEMCPFEVAHA